MQGHVKSRPCGMYGAWCVAIKMEHIINASPKHNEPATGRPSNKNLES